MRLWVFLQTLIIQIANAKPDTKLNTEENSDNKNKQNASNIKFITILKPYNFNVVLSVFIIFICLVVLVNFTERLFNNQIFELKADPVSGNSPNSVMFTYIIENIKDSVFINFDDYNNVTLKHYLPPGSSIIKNSFIIPNYSRVTVI